MSRTPASRANMNVRPVPGKIRSTNTRYEDHEDIDPEDEGEQEDEVDNPIDDSEGVIPQAKGILHDTVQHLRATRETLQAKFGQDKSEPEVNKKPSEFQELVLLAREAQSLAKNISELVTKLIGK